MSLGDRIVQATYSLKDNVSAGLKKIGAAWKGAEKDADESSEKINKSTDQLSDRFAAAAAGIGKFRAAIGSLGVVVGVLAGLSKLRDLLQAVFETGEQFDDLGKKFTTAFGGFEQGQKALEGVKAIAENVPFSLEEVSAAAVALRQRGFDPLDGSLQALIDNTVALDGNASDLQATIDTLGKAAIKGEIGTRALVSLTEKGIPVFQLLGRALGKSEAEIRKMAASGQLGAAEIKALVLQLGKLRAGAAADEVGDLDAQLVKLRDSLSLIKNELAQGGSLETAREQFADLNATVRELASSPEFARLKATFTQTFDAGVDAARAFIDNFDLVQVIAEIDQLTGQMRDLFKLLEASDSLIEPLVEATRYLTLPTKLLQAAVAEALNQLGVLVDGTGEKVAEAGNQIEGTVTPVTLLRQQLELARIAVEAFDDAQRAMKGGLTVEAKLITDQLGFLEGSAEQTRAKFVELFKTFQTDTDTRLGDVALALAEIGTRADNVAAGVRDGLGAELKKLSGEDLLRFQTAAQQAFDTMKVKGTEAANVLDPLLAEALSRLGVSGELLGQKITTSGQQIIATFRAVVENARSTSAQIETAFSGALSNATTVAEAEALGAALQRAGEQGRLGLDAMARSATDLRNRIEELKNAADPLADAYRRLGITAQTELDRIAQTAREDFDAIRASALNGERALDDVARAFVAMAQAQLNAVANASEFERKQVQAALRAQAAALGLESTLKQLGIEGEKAGEKIAGGANKATDALRSTEAAAEDTAAAAAAAGDESAQTFVTIVDGANAASTALDGVSEKFRQLENVGRFRRGSQSSGESQLFEQMQEQARLLDEEIARTNQAADAYDEKAQAIRDLAARYDLLDPSRVEALYEAERRLFEGQRRADEQRKREQQTGASGGTGGRTGSSNASAGAASGDTINITVAPQIYGDLNAETAERWSKQMGRSMWDQLAERKRLGAKGL